MWTRTAIGTAVATTAIGGLLLTGGTVAVAADTLTSEQKVTLAAMAEEEKLAQDVYLTFATTHGDPRFSRVAAAESRHLNAIRTLLDRYQVSDPTAGEPAGSFASEALDRQYTQFVAAGTTSLAAALEVGRSIEQADIAELNTAAEGLEATDIAAVYQRLSAASEQHLRTFSTTTGTGGGRRDDPQRGRMSAGQGRQNHQGCLAS